MQCLIESRHAYNEMLDRLSKSLKRFLARKELAMKVGFPRFKKGNQWHSIQLRQYGKDVYLHQDKKHLVIPAKMGKSIKIKLHRPIEGKPKTVHLVLRADGHWYALIVCETIPQTEHLPSTCEHPDIGIDVGLKSFLTDSEGNTVDNPRFYRTSQRTLRRKQRQLCRPQGYQLIVVEDLQVTNMVKNHHLAKSIMDASWSAFLNILSDKAERAGHCVRRVNPRFTSQKCHKCGEIVQKSLSVRTHICPFCGYVADRDVNAAQNILSKAGAQPSDVKHPNGDVRLRSPRL